MKKYGQISGIVKSASIIDKPAFDWLTLLSIKNTARLIKASKKRLMCSRYKIGIIIP